MWLFNLDDGDKDEESYSVNHCIYCCGGWECIPFAVLNGTSEILLVRFLQKEETEEKREGGRGGERRKEGGRVEGEGREGEGGEKKLSFRNRNKIKTFPFKQKLKELISTRPALQEMLKVVLQAEMEEH